MSSHFVSAHFGAAHYESSHYGRLEIVPTEPEVIHPMGSDPRTRALRARILREDEEILAIVMAFLEIKD
jgi:hypothetical protein